MKHLEPSDVQGLSEEEHAFVEVLVENRGTPLISEEEFDGLLAGVASRRARLLRARRSFLAVVIGSVLVATSAGAGRRFLESRRVDELKTGNETIIWAAAMLEDPGVEWSEAEYLPDSFRVVAALTDSSER